MTGTSYAAVREAMRDALSATRSLYPKMARLSWRPPNKSRGFGWSTTSINLLLIATTCENVVWVRHSLPSDHLTRANF
jgi:hypothetical protein